MAFYFVEEGPGRIQKTSRKKVTSTVLIFSSFSLFDGRHVWKNQNQLKKNCTKIEK
jgi:hypothetical protein